MTGDEAFDVAIIGAGPAGCCAALRLLALGHRVAIVERCAFPRSQIGESVSPGIWDILEYIGAAQIIAGAGFLHGLSARVIWSRREPELLTPEQRGPGLMLDRARFDARLLALAEERGARRIQPACVSRIEGKPGAWRIQASGPRLWVEMEARQILDASGRAPRGARQRFATAPVTVALWTETPGEILPLATCIEALPSAWLWGSPLPNGRFRVMAFVHLTTLKHAKPLGVETLLREQLGCSALFAPAAHAPFMAPIRACSATPYLDLEPWRPGIAKLGEAAFALDPLSSTGVEKAMRFALQAVIATNTVLNGPGSASLAQAFYESRLLESVATHTVWACAYYREAWPGQDHDFWRERSRASVLGTQPQPRLVAGWRAACAARERLEGGRADATVQTTRVEVDPAFPEVPRALWQTTVALSPEIRIVTAPCVMGDRVQLRAAITHPRLERPLAFLAGFELVPLLQIARSARGLGHLVSLWSMQMPAQTAARIAGWLRQRGLLVCASEPAAPSVDALQTCFSEVDGASNAAG